MWMSFNTDDKEYLSDRLETVVSDSIQRKNSAYFERQRKEAKKI